MITVRFRHDNNEKRRKGYRRTRTSQRRCEGVLLSKCIAPHPHFVILFTSIVACSRKWDRHGSFDCAYYNDNGGVARTVQSEVDKRKRNVFIPPS